MKLKDFIDQAQRRGENLKEEILEDLFKAKFVKELLESDLFSKAITTVLKTRDEVAKVMRQNVQSVLTIMDLPSRNDVTALENKVAYLEKQIDRVSKKAITVKSMKSLSMKKAAKTKRH
jgi:hypothetical protein